MSTDLAKPNDPTTKRLSSSRPDHGSTFQDWLQTAVEQQASDLHLQIGQDPCFRVDGELKSIPPWENVPITQQQLEQWISDELNPAQQQRLTEQGSVDGVLIGKNEARFRFNLFRSGGNLSIALRLLQNRFFSLEELGLPSSLYDACSQKDGLILVAGPTGSGKSTTLATLIHHINQTRRGHIITIEDPVEFTHRRDRCLVNQRQIGVDSASFHQALMDALRQDPDVILVGEIRDLDTIRTAIMAAETGHLVFASVHAADCVSAIERLISVFPGDEQQNIQHLLSSTLRAVIAQHLFISDANLSQGIHGNDPRPSRNRVLASEVLKNNSAIANLISAGNLNQVRSVLETGSADGMYTLDKSLATLVRKRKISESAARTLARNPEMIRELARKV